MRQAFMSIEKGFSTYSEGMTLAARTLNLGILAHVDAGKTTLTERLLYAAGVIDEIGSVDDGTTQTDSLALERQRGITIKSAVVSFAIDDLTVNLIDTPGHPDFIAEVERVLSVLDGAVLVISAVEGVQAQTRVLMRALQRLRIPTLIFVNKIDRPRRERRARAAGDRGATDAGDRPDGIGPRARHAQADFTPLGPADAALRARLTEVLAERDDGILAAYVDDETGVSYRPAPRGARGADERALVHPVFFGSAITGAGVEPLMAGSRSCCPRPRAMPTARSRAPSSRSNEAPPARRSPTSGCSPGPYECETAAVRVDGDSKGR